MKIVIAPDKFKNSLTGLAFCNAVEKGIRAVIPDCHIIKLPLADGGDGTINVVNYYLKGTRVSVMVNNPFFKPVTATYLFSKTLKTAYIEMAEASGLKLLKPEKLDCKNASTFGTGQLILHAIQYGATNIILGIGGSATNDCGIGMATALGFNFLDKNNKAIIPIGANLSKIKYIDTSNINPKLKTVTFKVACDVSNPLYGKTGAAYIYASQKGASPQDIIMLNKGLKQFSKLIKTVYNINAQHVKGAGAAGGMGIAAKVFLNAKLQPGITLIKNLANFNTVITDADWIITGEGKLDNQTLYGKTIKGVITSAKANNVKVAAFCGIVHLSSLEQKLMALDYIDAVTTHTHNLRDAKRNSKFYVEIIAKKFATYLNS